MLPSADSPMAMGTSEYLLDRCSRKVPRWLHTVCAEALAENSTIARSRALMRILASLQHYVGAPL